MGRGVLVALLTFTQSHRPSLPSTGSAGRTLGGALGQRGEEWPWAGTGAERVRSS